MENKNTAADLRAVYEAFMRNPNLTNLDAMFEALSQFATHPAPQAAAEGVDLLPPMGIRNDRDMLNYLIQAFNSEFTDCDHCHHSTGTANTDSAGFLRDYLAAAPERAAIQPAGELDQDTVRQIYATWKHMGETGMGLYQRFRAAERQATHAAPSSEMDYKAPAKQDAASRASYVELNKQLREAGLQSIQPAGEVKMTQFGYIATDLDGRADVGLTLEIAKERAGYGCDTIIPLYDIGAAPSSEASAPDSGLTVEQVIEELGVRAEVDAIHAERSAFKAPERSGKLAGEATVFVQKVPDECDRIVWRGDYYHLANLAAHSSNAAPSDGIKAACYRVDWSSNEPAGKLLLAAMKEEIAELRAALAAPAPTGGAA